MQQKKELSLDNLEATSLKYKTLLKAIKNCDKSTKHEIAKEIRKFL